MRGRAGPCLMPIQVNAHWRWVDLKITIFYVERLEVVTAVIIGRNIRRPGEAMPILGRKALIIIVPAFLCPLGN